MSSYRNVVKRKEHKERGQPYKRRQKHGLLEKHKDYLVRSKDFKQKRARIKALSLKADLRNTDEFHFHMDRSKVEKGHHVEIQMKELFSHDEIRQMKEQDRSYISQKRMSQQNKVERLSQSCHFIDEADPKRRNRQDDDGRDLGETGQADVERQELYAELHRQKERLAQLIRLEKAARVQTKLMGKDSFKKIVKDDVVIFKRPDIRKR